MANKHYSIRVDDYLNALADIKAALLDYYGAYNDPANPDGVNILYDETYYLIFTCTAIADKPIRVYVNSSERIFINWGSGYTAGDNLDDPVAFLGTDNTGTPSEMHLVLAPHTLLITQLLSTLYSKMGIIGQLTNGDYAVLGMVGQSNNTVGTAGYNTTDGTQFYPTALDTAFQSSDGKLYTQNLILRGAVSGVELNADGSIASFQDIHNASYVTDRASAVWGATFVLTYSNMGMDVGVIVLPTCLLMEYEEVT